MRMIEEPCEATIDDVVVCLAGAANMEIVEATDRIIAYFTECKANSKDNEDMSWFDEAYQELREVESLNNDLNDIENSIWDRLDVEDPTEDECENFDEAIYQFADVHVK